MHTKKLLLFLVPILSTCSGVLADTIALAPSSGYTSSGDTYFNPADCGCSGSHDADVQRFLDSLPNPSAPGDDGKDQAIVDGVTGAETDYQLNSAGFDFQFHHFNTGNDGASSSSTANIYFVATGANVTFSLSGSYTLSSADAYFTVTLSDYTADPGQMSPLYSAYLNQSSSADGTLNADMYSLTGNLIQGDVYLLQYQAGIGPVFGAPGSSDASGSLDLKFTDSGATAVPLPPAGWAGGAFLGLLGIHEFRRRTSSKRRD